MSVFDGSPIRHVGLRCSMSRSPMAVSDQACRSPMKHVEVSDGSPTRHVSLDGECQLPMGHVGFLMGLRSGISVSDVACRGL